MSYNSELQDNNTELQEILETINSLPEAGSGGNYDEGFADGKQQVIADSDLEEITVTGNPIRVDDVSEIAHNVTVQLSSDTIIDFSGIEVVSEGRNLYKLKSTSTSGSGVTFTVNDDGTIVANGTTTTSQTYVLCNPMNVEEGETYFCSGVPKGFTNCRMRFRKQLDGVSKGDIVDGGNGVEITVTSEFNQIRPVALVSSDATVENAVFRPRIQLSTERDTTYISTANGVLSIPSKFPEMAVLSNNSDINLAMTYYKSKGIQTEYDRFWDALQQNGEYIDMQSGFMGYYWNDDCYNPKYPIRTTNCTSLLRANNITDVKVPVDLTRATGTHFCAYSQYIRRIPLVIVNENIAYTSWFLNNKALEEVYFGDKDGEQNYIGKSISFAQSPLLTAGSVDSICSHLSPTATGQTITFNEAVKETYHEARKTGWGTTTADETWNRLCAEHPNWTFVFSNK